MISKKFLQGKSMRKICKTGKTQNRAESGKKDQQVVNNFSGVLLQLKSKNSEKATEIQWYRAYCQTNSDQKYDLVSFKNICNGANIFYFLDNMLELLIFLPFGG